MRPPRISAPLAALLALLWLACGEGDGASRHAARGIVREVQHESGQIVIEHEEIVGLMPAMTMNFDVPDHSLLDSLAPGQAIDFTVEFTGRSYRVVAAEVTGEAGAAGRSGSGATLAGAAAVRDPAPAFELIAQDGAKLSLASLRGKLVVLDFVYTTCAGPCPILTSTHVSLQRMLPAELRERTRFVSISLDPVRDTPAALRSYAEERGADLTGWSFLTGSPEAVSDVISRYGVGSIRRPDGQIDHLVVTFLIDAQGQIVKRYIGLEHEAEAMLRDLEGLRAG